MDRQSEETVIAWLNKRHSGIMDYEKAALALLQAGDVDGYRKNMREKAEALANLADDAETVLAALNTAERKQIGNELANFSDNAATALELDSVFYMSALLYPEDHKKGEPDNLELYIARLAKQWDLAV